MRYTETMFEFYAFTSAAVLVVTVILAVVIYRQSRLHKKIDRLFAGLDHNDNIADTLERYFTHVKATKNKLDSLTQSYQHLSKIAAASLQKTAIVRFNPFKHTGGDQSFALAMLDNHDNGFVLTSIHSREGTRVYIKPISYGASDYTLSREEQSALETAKSTTDKPHADKSDDE